MKKRISVFLIILIILTTAFVLPANAAEGELGSGTPDGTPPVLYSVELLETAATAPGTINVTASAGDDVSGVSSVYVSFRCKETDKSLSCSLGKTYWDEETREYVPYADGKFHGTIQIDQYVESGTFRISHVSVYDVAGNSAYYSSSKVESDDPEYPVMPEAVKNLQFTVTDEGGFDSTPPVLHTVQISTTSVTAPGTIDVTASAEDDVSGVSSVYVSFRCKETDKSLSCSLGKTYWDEETREYVPYADGRFHGTIEIGQYVESGNFQISHVSVYDVAGNSAYYSSSKVESDDPEYPVMPASVKALQFYVTESEMADGNPPELYSVELATTSATAPGYVDITASAGDDVSGVSSVYVSFRCKETDKSLSCSLGKTYWDEETREYVPYADGRFHGTIEIGQYVESGNFQISHVSVYDVAGNSAYYSSSKVESDDPEYPVMPEAVKNLQFTVFNTTPDVTTSVAKPEFVDQAEQAEDNAYIVADYSGEATLTEDAFDAIAGTGKTLDLVSDGVTWRFNGEDIVNEVKPIELNVQISKVEETGTSSGQAIQEQLEETPGVVMKFAENGELPGKATIQVKVDYAMREYLGASQKLCVYYYNNQTGQLELVAKDLNVINDTYVEFSITHCSYYVLTTMETATEGWVQEGDFWYYYESGNKLTGWLLDGSKWYYLESDGRMAANTWRKDSIGWCYLGGDGAMLTNCWATDSKGWCYIGPDGYCETNCWKADSIGWLYLDSEGSMTKNQWVYTDSYWYYLDSEGYMATDCWRRDSYGWCYLGSNGAMLTNCWAIDSKGWCYIGANGYCETNCWKQDSYGWLYLDSEGSMTKSQWLEDGGAWYYLDDEGYLVTGEQEIDGTWYVFNDSGIWVG